MASPELWLYLLAWIKTVLDAGKSAIDFEDSLLRHLREPDTIKEAQRASVEFSTFSDAEVESLLNRIKGCRDRFIEQGGGLDRARCICSVLQQAVDGNGGSLPVIDDWVSIYSQLNCGKFARSRK